MEQAKGHSGNNVVTVLMREYGYSLQQACDHVGVHFEKLMDRFLADKPRLRSFGDASVDANIANYIKMLEHWVRGSLEWSFDSQRYFGIRHKEIRETRVVVLRSPGAPEKEL